jgi:epoxyqueuosine reductase
VTAAGLIGAARGAGFHGAALVDPAALARWGPGLSHRAPAWMDLGRLQRPETWQGRESILVCALSVRSGEPDDLSTAGDPHALVAPFARRGYYAAAVALMQDLHRALAAGQGCSLKGARIFVNSKTPEKPLLASSGLGCYGKNGLTIVPGLGTLFLIAVTVLPFAVERPRWGEAGESARRAADGFPLCGSCTRCIDACPAAAIVEPGVVDPRRCLQGLAEDPAALDPLTMERWGRRLYGCQDCQSVCPHNAGLSVQGPGCAGGAGPSVSIRRLLAGGEGGLAGLFEGTPLGMRRIRPEALLRNVLVAAGNSGDPSLAAAVRAWTGSSSAVLRSTALWALDRLRG